MPKDLNFSVLLDYYGNMLTDKQRRMMECYYYDDLSLSEIAANEGITRQGVRDAVKRSEAELLNIEQKLGFVKSYGNIEQDAEKIADCCKLISEKLSDADFTPPSELNEINSICDKYIEKD